MSSAIRSTIHDPGWADTRTRQMIARPPEPFSSYSKWVTADELRFIEALLQAENWKALKASLYWVRRRRWDSGVNVGQVAGALERALGERAD